MFRIIALSLAVAATLAHAELAPSAPATVPAPAPTSPTAPAALPGSPAAAPAAPVAQPVTTPAAAPKPQLESAVSEKKANPAPKQITVTRSNVDGPYAAITFDDGPHGVQTPRLLKMLKERGVRSTFFVVGQCVAANPEIARQILAEGHEIANHSWNHPLLSKMGEDSVRDQLQRTHSVVRQETGATMTLMRPPYGGFTANQRGWAHATWGYQCVLWDVDSFDWKHRSPAKTQAIILAETRPGSIILCHDIHKTTVDAMPATLDALIAKGFKLVTVSELLKMQKDTSVASAKPAAPARTLSAKEAADAATSLGEVQKANPAVTGPAKP